MSVKTNFCPNPIVIVWYNVTVKMKGCITVNTRGALGERRPPPRPVIHWHNHS